MTAGRPLSSAGEQWRHVDGAKVLGSGCPRAADLVALYDGFSTVGLQYGPGYRTLVQAWSGGATGPTCGRLESRWSDAWRPSSHGRRPIAGSVLAAATSYMSSSSGRIRNLAHIVLRAHGPIIQLDFSSITYLSVHFSTIINSFSATSFVYISLKRRPFTVFYRLSSKFFGEHCLS